MRYKLSVFTTVTNPTDRGDNAVDAVRCYRELADEVVLVNGGDTELFEWIVEGDVERDKNVMNFWPKEFDWSFIGQQFTRGYKACTGDIVIHADLDFIFHEKDFNAIRVAGQQMLDNNLPAMKMYKYQFVLPDRYNLKSHLVLMVNKRDYGDRIKFDSGRDLTQPSLDGKYLDPHGVPDSKVGFYNFEKLAKTAAQIKDDCGRMERAYYRHFNKYQFRESDGSDEKALEGWLTMVIGRFRKPQKKVNIDDLPKYVRETIRELRPDQWGYDGFGHLPRAFYKTGKGNETDV